MGQIKAIEERESHGSAYLAVLDLYCCFVFEVHVLIE